MKEILYVDDVRFPNAWKERANEVVIARTYEQALKNLVIYKFDIIDLDHDLGEEKTGYDIAKFIIENNVKCNKIYIHSANPVGVFNMKQLLKRYGYIVEIYN